MKRRGIFNFSAVASLLLCVAFIAMWLRSYFQGDRFVRQIPSRANGVVVSDGRIAIIRMSYTGGAINNLVASDGRWQHQRGDRQIVAIDDPVQTAARVRSFTFGTGSGAGLAALGWGYEWWTWIIPSVGTRSCRELIVPFWALVLPTFAVPLRWLLGYRGRRRNSGVCANSSYNLTGNTSGICPECGTAVLRRSKATA